MGLVREVAIDLGTTETRLFSSDGLILSEPTLVALQSEGGRGSKILAIGDEALVMEGRTPKGITVVRPIRDGSIVDIDLTSQMLKYFIEKARRAPSIFRPLDVVICVPSGSTGLERRALANAAQSAGASKVSFVLQSMAAAIGAGLAVTEPIAFMMLTIGGGVSESAIISLQGIAYVATIKSGGDRITEEILSYLRRYHNLSVGWSTAENLKRQFGVASPVYADKNRRILVRGIDTVNSVPKEIAISEFDLAEVILYSISGIVEVIKTTLENAPPMLAADIIETGLVVAGGGALLRSLKDYLEDEIGLPVAVANDPSSAVARGINISMTEPRYSGVLMAQ
jgi:rod shape-determining protein MreB